MANYSKTDYSYRGIRLYLKKTIHEDLAWIRDKDLALMPHIVDQR